MVACCLEWGRKPRDHLELTLTCSLVFSLRFYSFQKCLSLWCEEGSALGKGSSPVDFGFSFLSLLIFWKVSSKKSNAIISV